MQGVIDQAMVDRLLPQIMVMRHESCAPITMYIDSPGGSPQLAGSLWGILACPTQNSSLACRLITVGTNFVASAAADLLAGGDYAISYRESTIHFHGTRQSLTDPLTVETAASLIEHLKGWNDRSAMDLARKSIARVMFLYVTMLGKFNEHRERFGKKKDDLECFTELVALQLSPRAATLMTGAKLKYARYRLLNSYLLQRPEFKENVSSWRWADFEALMLKTVIDFSLQENQDPSWSMREGFSQISEDFVLVASPISRRGDPQLTSLCNTWGGFVLTEEQTLAISQLSDDTAKSEKRLELLTPIFEPLWFYFVALCQVLQEGEFRFSATDAYWLGLIDEVLGTDLPTIRLVLEYQPEPSKQPRSKSSRKGSSRAKP